MNFKDACKQLANLLLKSKGKSICLPTGEEYEFSLIRIYNDLELDEYEKKLSIKLPDDYKYFLKFVGASKIYFDEFGLGIEIHPLEYLSDFSYDVFEGMNNPFPSLFIIASNLGSGDFFGFDLRDGESERFANLSHEENPEEWLDDTTSWSTFSKWLTLLIESEGSEDYT